MYSTLHLSFHYVWDNHLFRPLVTKQMRRRYFRATKPNISLIKDAQVSCHRSEVALHTDVASDAFKTSKVNHKEDRMLRKGNFWSVMGVMCTDALSTHTAEPRGPWVWLLASQRAPGEGLGHSRKFVTSWYFKKLLFLLGEWSTLSLRELSMYRWPPTASLGGQMGWGDAEKLSWVRHGVSALEKQVSQKQFQPRYFPLTDAKFFGR